VVEAVLERFGNGNKVSKSSKLVGEAKFDSKELLLENGVYDDDDDVLEAG